MKRTLVQPCILIETLDQQWLSLNLLCYAVCHTTSPFEETDENVRLVILRGADTKTTKSTVSIRLCINDAKELVQKHHEVWKKTRSAGWRAGFRHGGSNE